MGSDQINVFQVERAAIGLLERYGINQPGFDIEDLAAAEEIEIRRGGLRNVDAWLLRKPSGGGIIRLRDDMVEKVRERFSIGHELGHWTLHPSLSQGFLCTAANFRDYTASREEAEANMFAANLLMPRAWVRPERLREDPSFAVISSLAAEFETTLTASSRRYIELVKHPVVLVYSRNGTVQWSLKSSSAKPLFVERKVALPANSLTAECLESGKTAGPEKIDPATWFPNWEWSDDSELFEDVRVSSEYEWALTLLWVPELQ